MKVLYSSPNSRIDKLFPYDFTLIFFCNIDENKKVVESEFNSEVNQIRIYHACESGVDKYVPRSTVWHHEDC